MKLVMTLQGGGEPDVVDANVAFHLNAGVDFVVADQAGDVLEPYARSGYVRPAPEGAEWIFTTEANEFWWPRGGSLKEVLASVPDRYGDVRALVREFVWRPDDGSFFAERMIERRAAAAGAGLKSIYRAGSGPVPLRGWYPVEVLRFPTGPASDGGESVVDTRLRDALRALRLPDAAETFALPEEGRGRLSFQRPSVVDDAAYAVEVAALGESDLARVQKRLEELEGRLAALERAHPATKLGRAAQRLLGRRR
jgi:hypothetical protein